MNGDKYKLEYCDLLIDMMSKGYSLGSFCAEIKINRDTAYNWKERHPEFAQACLDGYHQGLRFYEDLLVNAAKGLLPEHLKEKGSKGVNLTAVIFTLKTRFHREYGEASRVEIPDATGHKTITVNIVDTKKIEEAQVVDANQP